MKRPSRPFPPRLYVTMQQLRGDAREWHLFAHDDPPTDTDHGELVGIYDLTDVGRQVVARSLTPTRTKGSKA